MLGTRGCRLGILLPGDLRDAGAGDHRRRGRGARARPAALPSVEIMIPLVDYERELEAMRSAGRRDRRADDPRARVKPIEYAVGTMIELPRACLIADRIAAHADFFSFGTNDLTQTALGFSRDDIESKFLARYIEQRIVDRSPFETIDVPGVGALVRIGASRRGRAAQPGDQARHLRRARRRPGQRRVLRATPALDYVSCSPFRVPVARVAAAQAAIRRAALTWRRGRPLRVAVVAEYYPRPSDPALGVWAHRQALAVREHGVEVRVLALTGRCRRSACCAAGPAALREWLRGARGVPRSTELDGIPVRYVRFVSPPRPLAYATWGRWAARPLGRALDELAREWPFDVVHAHYAVPAGDAVLRWMRRRGQAAAGRVGARRRPVVSTRAARSAGARWSARPCAAPTR